MIKLIISDLDHTLLTDDKEITEKTINVIEKLKAQGIGFTIATGRSFELALPYALQVQVTHPIILSNGALIKDAYDNTIYDASTIDEDIKAITLEYATEHHLPFTFYTEGALMANPGERAEFYSDWALEHPETNTNVIVSEDINDFKAVKAYKMLLVIEDEILMESTYQHLSKLPNCHVTRSQQNFLDILPATANKGSAVAKLMKLSQVNPDEIIVFGDHDNDVEMLSMTPNAYVMPNGSPKAKAASSKRALDNQNDSGVAKTLESLLEGTLFNR